MPADSATTQTTTMPASAPWVLRSRVSGQTAKPIASRLISPRMILSFFLGWIGLLVTAFTLGLRLG